MYEFLQENECTFIRSSAKTQAVNNAITSLSHCLIQSASKHHYLIMPSTTTEKMSCRNWRSLEITLTHSYRASCYYRNFLFTNKCTSDCLKNNTKICIKIAPTCFGAVTSSSGSAIFVLAKVTLVKISNYGTSVCD